ncbi:hypothetical protein WPS_30180 [Vulcanimicrobium alpinum]|uniref:Uncharacterized protein n=1 Tax=Vulcanimicrobium alpinum TaxID=3016050 RepID=A0AAN1XYI3_UNVUL|nr:hypothetical protein [Vulcanimicrobium alpinum]BDE07742.1 hypothetical protein WPS_30180 [Vulcanimicrobium alpinum]
MSAERALLAACGAGIAFVGAVSARPAQAVPLFAQRYNLQCGACHSVLPELNAFGNEFRNRGYRIYGLPKHGTTVVALREQVGYTETPPSGSTTRTVPAGALLGAVEVGRVEAFVHESLGSQGGPSSLFLGYLAYHDDRSKTLYRAGLFEMPLVHSPAQRNDTLTTYGYEGSRVGLNELTLATPRWGLEAEHRVGNVDLAATAAYGNSAGSAYGGKPVPTGTTQTFATPEYGLYARVPIAENVRVGADAIAGNAAIVPLGRARFTDAYRRMGLSLDARRGRLELLAEQWWGRDDDGDGQGGRIDSTGGFARLRWRLGNHAFVGVREDGFAAPAATRSLLWFAEAHVTAHARVLIQQSRPIPGGPTALQGALTVGFPWPRGR